MKPKYINVERLLYAIRMLPTTPNGHSDTYDKAEIITIIEDIVDTETKQQDVITIRPECTDCHEINLAHQYYAKAIIRLEHAEIERAKFARNSRYYAQLYWYAYHHPFRFFFTALFHKDWKVEGDE